jgi:hypothetical protein
VDVLNKIWLPSLYGGTMSAWVALDDTLSQTHLLGRPGDLLGRVRSTSGLKIWALMVILLVYWGIGVKWAGSMQWESIYQERAGDDRMAAGESSSHITGEQQGRQVGSVCWWVVPCRSGGGGGDGWLDRELEELEPLRGSSSTSWSMRGNMTICPSCASFFASFFKHPSWHTASTAHARNSPILQSTHIILASSLSIHLSVSRCFSAELPLQT